MAKKLTTRKAKLTTAADGQPVVLSPGEIRCLKVWWRLYRKNEKEPSMRLLSAELGLTDNSAAPIVRKLDRKGIFNRPVVQVPGPRVLSDIGKLWLDLAS